MWHDLESRVDQRVTLAGTALNAAAGAIVSLDGRPVYVSELREWPQHIVGSAVEVSGILVFRPAPRPEGPVVHQPDDTYALRDASWTVTS